MARYIDADLIKNIELIPYKRCSGNINAIVANMAIAGAKQVVDKIPTADVQPVVHAHWVTQRNHSTCSNCGKYRGDWRTESFAYCQHCGAKMDEEVS